MSGGYPRRHPARLEHAGDERHGFPARAARRQSGAAAAHRLPKTAWRISAPRSMRGRRIYHEAVRPGHAGKQAPTRRHDLIRNGISSERRDMSTNSIALQASSPGARTGARTGAGTGTGTRVLIVDDSAVARALIARQIEPHARFQVVGAVAHVEAALAFLAIRPRTSSCSTYARYGRHHRAAPADRGEWGRTDHHRLGLHPGGWGSGGAGDGARRGRHARQAPAARAGRVRRCAAPETRCVGLPPSSEARLLRPHPPCRWRRPSIGKAWPEIIGIGASTGGIHALAKLFAPIPTTMTVPIVVTQHLPATFIPFSPRNSPPSRAARASWPRTGCASGPARSSSPRRCACDLRPAGRRQRGDPVEA